MHVCMLLHSSEGCALVLQVTPKHWNGVAYVTRRDVPILCPGILRILATALVSSDTQSYLRSSQNSDETYNNSSNIDWRRKVCICSNIW